MLTKCPWCSELNFGERSYCKSWDTKPTNQGSIVSVRDVCFKSRLTYPVIVMRPTTIRQEQQWAANDQELMFSLTTEESRGKFSVNRRS